MKSFKRIFFTLLVLSLLAACDSKNDHLSIITAEEEITESEFNDIQSGALAVIEAACTVCHTGFHDDWKDFNHIENYIDAGLVVPGQPELSALLLYMSAYDSNGTMPPAEETNIFVTVEDVRSLTSWIESYIQVISSNF